MKIITSYPPRPEKPTDAEIFEGLQLNAQMVVLCPSRFAHVSYMPGYGRVKCPTCGKYYVAKGEAK